MQRVLCRQPPDETYAYGSGSLADFGDSLDSPMVERMGYEDGKVFEKERTTTCIKMSNLLCRISSLFKL